MIRNFVWQTIFLKKEALDIRGSTVLNFVFVRLNYASKQAFRRTALLIYQKLENN